MSDHGSNKIRREFNINTWLAREGYLVLNRSTSDILASVGVTAENARALFGRLGSGWYSRAKSLVPDTVKEYIPSEDGGVKRGGKASKVDWEASTAIASGQGPVYLLTDDDQVRHEIAEALEAVEDHELGQGPVDEVHLGEDVYEGEYVDRGPDLVVEQTRGWHITGSVGSETVFSEPTTWTAENKRTGMFAMVGPDFDSTEEPLSLSILDLAPTLLHLYGLPVPEVMDGTVAEQVFAEGSYPATVTPE
jgi:predicted AlkP superfamily phosphohydrolase/phosphomutase